MHHSASNGFSTAAEIYARARPGYPPEALDWLRDVLGLGPGKTVLEVGAGTGKFLPLLIETGADVVALEPVDAMRAQIAARFDVKAISGTATDINLPDGSVDAVVCAQAFHWFATPEAVEEFCRLLRPGGVLGLIWNVRDTSTPWVSAMSAILDRHVGDTPRHEDGKWREVLPTCVLAFLGERRARHFQVGSPQQVIVDRALSVSYIAALPPTMRAVIEHELRSLIEETSELRGRAEISFPYDTLMIAFGRLKG